jgi:linoleoyl-CoA desaturase
MSTETIESPLAKLSDEEIEQLGREFDAIHDEVFNDLGERDAIYIKSMIAMHRRLVAMGRVELLGARYWPLWLLGTASLSAAKILENMEIGHNVMHGQWDWMNNPEIHSSTWDWDTASTKEAWKHSHNYIHHTYTNIRGKDKDLGYEIMRIDPHQKWHPVYLMQPIYNVMLMLLFEWGVAVHDLDLEAIRSGEKSQKEVLKDLKGIAGKARTQIVKDYIAFPTLSGLAAGGVAAGMAALKARGRGRIARRREGTPFDSALEAFKDEFKRTYRSTLWADVSANVVRNIWSNWIIFCGHFPDQTYTFSQEEVEDESKGGWYVRQLLGAANIEGSAFFHVASGNLGYQVEHHLYPDMPSTRYGEIAPKVRDVCKRYGLPYNSGPFWKQWGSVQRTIIRLAFPGGKPRPKPGPYQGRDTDPAPATREQVNATNGNGNAPSSESNGKPAPTEHAEAEGPSD